MPPHEVLERFTEDEMVRLVAYEEEYGQLGPERFDTLFGRLGMDVVAPHLKKGKKPKLKDHMVQWGGKKKHKQTPEQMLAIARSLTSAYQKDEKKREKQKQKQQKRQQNRAAQNKRRARQREEGHNGRTRRTAGQARG